MARKSGKACTKYLAQCVVRGDRVGIKKCNRLRRKCKASKERHLVLGR